MSFRMLPVDAVVVHLFLRITETATSGIFPCCYLVEIIKKNEVAIWQRAGRGSYYMEKKVI